MKTIFSILLIAISTIAINAQENYKVGETFIVDDSLTLLVTNDRYAGIVDVKKRDYIAPVNPDIPDHSLGIIDGSGFTPPLSPEIAKTMMQIFREVFTEQELDYLSKYKTRYVGKENFSFCLSVNLKGDVILLRIRFYIVSPLMDAISKDKIGKLYKLVVDRIKFKNMRDTGLGGVHYIGLDVPIIDVVNGTLDYSNLMRDINKEGCYINYYWKDGKVYSFE